MALIKCFYEELLQYILSNLFLNAINYSPQDGLVHFNLFCEDKVVSRIQDEGMGIPVTGQDQLFNLFCRASKT